MVRRTTSPVWSPTSRTSIPPVGNRPGGGWRGGRTPHPFEVAQRRLPAGQPARAIGAGGRTCPGAGPGPRRRRRWVGAAIAGLLVLGLFGGRGGGSPASTTSEATTATSRSSAGIPQNVGSLSLSSVVETTAIPTVQLPVYAQELVTATIAAESRTDADRIVAILDEQATTCRTKPKTEGCPV